MSTYVIQKKTECNKCGGRGTLQLYAVGVEPTYENSTFLACSCAKGYIYEEVEVELTKIGSYIVFSLPTPDLEEE